jgi:PleD family two-component response regulator
MGSRSGYYPSLMTCVRHPRNPNLQAADPGPDSHESKLAPLKVLIVDDQSTGRIVLSEIMRSLDPSLEVVTFADPIEAIEFARTHPVDMVLTITRCRA